MGMEQRRLQFMRTPIEWGDSPSPPHLSKQVDFGGSSAAVSERDLQSSRDHSPGRIPLIANSRGGGDDRPQQPGSIPEALIMADRQARKKPISKLQDPLTCKDWTLESLVRKSKNFHHVPRVRWSAGTSTEALIRRHDLASSGIPLVVEGLNKHPGWLQDEFTPEWFEASGPDVISVRNVHDRTDKDMPLSDFIACIRATTPFKTPNEKERLYGKDVVCPATYNDFLHSGIIPSYLSPESPENVLNNLPESSRPETLMCYIGVGDTFTPCHKDLCASSGHNLMCYTEKGGSSFWFMTATSSANAAAEYFQNVLNEVLDHETHVITVDELAKAPFKIYITEQKLGDLVLVPPRSMHQVVNAGGITIKTSWSRMTLDGLSLALRYELPLYRRVCRSEIYRVKATIYHTLLKTVETVSDRLCAQPDSPNTGAGSSQKDMPMHLSALRQILLLFDSILIEEYSPEANNMRKLAKPEGNNEEIEQLACDFCGGDIFLSFFECHSCVRAAPGAGFIVCPGCYVEGRTCACEFMLPMQCRSVDELFKARTRAFDLFEAFSKFLHKKADGIPSTQQLRKDGRLGLFRAAIVLRKRRIHMTKGGNHDSLRRCNRSKKDFHHDIPNLWMLLCTKCHSGSCFAHLTWTAQLHSAEALLAIEKDKTGAGFHEAHLASKDRYSSVISILKREELNHVPNLGVQLAYMAMTFPTCRPINPNSKLWKTGHYDLKAWEIALPNQRISDKAQTSIVSRPAAKRFVMDYVLVPSGSRPAERKDRADRPVSPVVRSEPQITSVQNGTEVPSRRRPEATRPPSGQPGISSSSSLKRPAAKPSRAKAPIRVDSSSESDSEEERPLKRPRVHSRISKPLAGPRSQADSSQPAASLADAFNTASVQNSKSIPNTVRRQPPPSASAPAPALPPKKAKQNAVTVSRGELSSLPAEGSSRPTSSAGIEDKLTAIMAHLSTVVEVQANQAAELSQMRRVYSGHGPEVMADPAVAERQSLATETTVKVVADLVNGLVSALRPHPQPRPTSSSSMGGSMGGSMGSSMGGSIGSSMGGSMGGSSQNWHSPSYRGRGRGRGGGVNFGDHPYRSMPSRDIHSDYRPTRQHHYEHHNAPFPVATRHFDQPVPRGYYERRVWYEGPHAHEERQRYHHPYAVEREQREPQEPRRKRRTFTRFSPPNSPENNNSLGLVVSRSRPSYPPNQDGEGSGSEGSGTVTNASDTARNPEAFAGNARAEAGSTAKFFEDLTRPLNVEEDAQDWEAGYGRDN